MHIFKQILVSALFAVGTIAVGYGQLTTATVSGTVADASGAAVPGANVRLENVSQGVTKSVAAGADGRFSFDFVAIGTYRLTVSQAGFNTVVRNGVDLASGQVLDLPIQLDIQQQSQSVEVSAEAAAIDTSTAAQVADLNTSQVHDLPVSHLNWTNLLTVSAGATIPPVTSTLNSTSPQGSGVNINGLPSAGYNFTVDGTNASNNVVFVAFNFYQGVGLINTVNNDAIQELSTAKGVPPATVGGGMSGNINIVTRSGSNQIHGSMHELNEVSLLDARNQFLTTKPKTVFNDYGFSAGLPIFKNKLFFFGSYEAASQIIAKAITGGVPSPYLLSTAPAVYLPVLRLFPSAPQPANPTATTSNYFGAASNSQTDDNGVYRFDYYLNQSNTISLRYIRSRPTATSPSLIAINPRHYFDRGDAVSITHTHSSVHWTENTRVAYNQIDMLREDANIGDPTFFNVTFGWSSFGSKLTHWYGNYKTVQEAVAYVHGKQTIQFGGIYERNTAKQVQISPTTFTYSSLAQFLADTPNTATLQLNSFPPGAKPFTNNPTQYGGYVQDDIKATKNLTVNFGFRYDIFTVPGEVQNRIFNRGVDPGLPQLGPGFGPITNTYYRPDHSQYQPRIGLAYNLFGTGKTALRAGFGKLSSAHPLYSAITNTYQLSPSEPFSYALNTAQTKASGIGYPYDATGYVQQLTRLQGAGIISSDLPVTIAINPHFPDPYSLQWTVGIEQALPYGITMEANYNGNRGLHETFAQEALNQPDRITGIAPKPTWGKLNYATADDRSKYAAAQFTLRKRLEHDFLFSSSFTYARVSSFGAGDILQASVPQDPYNFHADWGPAPFDINLRWVTHAIWDIPLARWTGRTGRFSDLALNGWQLTGVFLMQSGLPANVTNAASGNTSDRPNATGLPAYLSGYQTGIHQLLNPAAFAVIPLSTLSGLQVTPGNLGNDAVRIPGVINLDLTVSKVFAITERVHMQLRMDTFNTLNHTNLSGLVTTINTPSIFGQLTTATARTLQIAGRISF